MITFVPSQSIRVLLVDDEPLLRRSLRIAIDREPDLTVVGEAATGTEAVTQAIQLLPDIVLMDIRMPDGDGIHATHQISTHTELNASRVIMLTMFELDEYVYGALGAGASGFLLKDAHPVTLLDAIRRVHAGESLFAPTILTKLIDHYVTESRPARTAAGRPVLAVLTPRETEVLGLVASGLSNDEIVSELCVSGNTVKTHIGNLLAKLHARDRAQLVIAAYNNGLTAAHQQSDQ